jgi:hypothetical protein
MLRLYNLNLDDIRSTKRINNNKNNIQIIVHFDWYIIIKNDIVC